MRGRLALGTTLLAAVACGRGGTDVRSVATVELSATAVSVAAGADAPLTARLRDAAGGEIAGRTVVWTTRDPSVATLAQSEALTTVVRGVAPGTTEIAANAEGHSAVATVTVSPRAVARVVVQPPSVDLRVTGTTQLQVRTLDAAGGELTGRAVTFASSDESVATVSATGAVVARAPGGTTITVRSEQQSTLVAVTVTPIPTTSVVVAPTNPSVIVGRTVQFVASALDSLGRTLAGRAATWSTSDARIATVSSTGLATGIAAGTARITATVEGVSASQTLTVTLSPVAAVALGAGKTTLVPGDTTLVSARLTDAAGNVLAGRAVAYASDAPAVATVDAATGVVMAVAAGTVTISGTSEGVRGTLSLRVNPTPVAAVTVTPPNATLIVGGIVRLAATATSASGAILTGRPVTWTSGAPSIVRVDPDGTVTALAGGTAIVFASVDGVLGQATILVNAVTVASVAVTPSPSSVQVGRTVDLTATARDAAGGQLLGRTVTWTSSDQSVATVSSTGRVTALRAGTATISATVDGVTGRATVTVVP